MITTKNISQPENMDFSPDQFFVTMAKLGVDADYIAHMVEMRRARAAKIARK